jgi:hypothetical protein
MKHSFILGLIKSRVFLYNMKTLYFEMETKLNNILKTTKQIIPLAVFFSKQTYDYYYYLLTKDESIDSIDFVKSFFFYFLTEDKIKLKKRDKFIDEEIKVKIKMADYFYKKKKKLYYLSKLIKILKGVKKKEKKFFFSFFKYKILKKNLIKKTKLKQNIVYNNMFINENIFINVYNNSSLLLDLNQYFKKKNRF